MGGHGGRSWMHGGDAGDDVGEACGLWRDIFVQLAIASQFTFGCAPTTYWLELEYILIVSLNVPQDLRCQFPRLVYSGTYQPGLQYGLSAACFLYPLPAAGGTWSGVDKPRVSGNTAVLKGLT